MHKHQGKKTICATVLVKGQLTKLILLLLDFCEQFDKRWFKAIERQLERRLDKRPRVMRKIEHGFV